MVDTPTTEKPLAGKIVLVTGASRGIGYFAAREIAARGAHVVAVARTVGGLEELDDEIKKAGGSATLVPLDLADYDGIDRLGASVFERWGRLDGLIGNAGILGPITPLAHMAPKDFERLFAINVTANYRLIRSLDLPLRKSDAGRALFLSSGVVNRAQAYWGPYTATKAALEALIKTYAAETKSTKLAANIFNPGPLRTSMRAQGWPGEDPSTLKHPEEAAGPIADMLAPTYEGSGMHYNFPTGETKPIR